MPTQCHGCLNGLSIGHVKLLENIVYVLGLTYESLFLHLLDLKSKKELQFTHHGHFKPFGHDPTKFLTKLLISRTKYNVINIYLANKYILTNFMSKKSRIGFAH